VVEAAPAAALVVAEPDLLLELLVVPLDEPARLGVLDNVAKPPLALVLTLSREELRTAIGRRSAASEAPISRSRQE
jgi:hypothetical protein